LLVDAPRHLQRGHPTTPFRFGQVALLATCG
jgi:hypothetical protein